MESDMVRPWAGFWRSKNGAILFEAAIVLPILVVLLIGMVEFSQAFSVRSRTNQVAANIADLVAELSSVTNGQLNNISKIAQYLFEPYPAAPLQLRITSVIRNANDSTTAQWSYASGGMSALPQGQAVALPVGLIDQQETVILTETTYTYTPILRMFLPSGITFTSVAYFKPRLVTAITHN